ncbi:hypothetical protein IFM89_023181 [Coptis chinensis]|uniref:Uncharacterized protein n=1 Tax=Coptis chinensis TaxID=261450 RepID=A0A835LS50_9MAGN|nr:hypothetical protein IFM89_023181 [Coptis chinensis]
MTKIVRFSTKRSGEIGRLPIEWTNCLIPLVNSKRVKLRARCVAAPSSLFLMQEIHLYVSFYIHHSIFTDGEKSSWSLTTPSNLDTTVHPLPTLFKLLKIVPSQKAAFTPEELDTFNALSVYKFIYELLMSNVLQEMDPPSTLMCVLHPYQKQALYWMSESEKGIDVEEAAKMLHPCWAAYRITDKRASAVYVNIFSGEATTRFPSATKMARGGSGKGVPDEEVKRECKNEDVEERKQNKTQVQTKSTPTAKGGTLIVCPMALLGQWKDSDHSIFHRVEWFRVVLDEAHTIKSSKTQIKLRRLFSVLALPLVSYWYPSSDLYSLLCFLHVEPWCNWAWWQKLIQKPYDNGDERGMRLIKSILRPLMLRRTKDTKDKEGRPILVLPPTDIQVIECKQSEAERDFYEALFKRSKVQFDQFVAQGKVLHNYAHILELLLRLRQCCNHPFLVMSRADTQKYTDLDKLTRQFLETSSNTSGQSVPSREYVEEVVEGIRKGQNTECPICLESADDPVFTPCAHRMCRECIFPAGGAHQMGSARYESSKVSKLLTCLEQLRLSGSGEKSIIFSQWTSFFDLLEIALKKKGIGFLRFDGKLSQKNREYVLKEFSDSKEKMVLLMSLKAGGVGLNLTAASNVFLMANSWDAGLMGCRTRKSMQEVQARKERMIAGALTDGEVRSVRIEELKMLFR